MKAYFLWPLLLASSAMAQVPDTSSALFSMREAERNFARSSVMIGRNAAFAENFADESVIFTDRWLTNGKQFSKERKPAPVVLKWEPEYMDISASRDFGISTGPWEAQEYRPNTAPVATGYFLTVWKKFPDGSWKVILDGGSETPVNKDSHHKFSFPDGADKPFPNPPVKETSSSCKELLESEKQISEEWTKNPLSYMSFLAPDSRMQLKGHLPSTERDTIKTWIGHLDKSFLWKSVGAGAATSGDLAFTYGVLEMSGNHKLTKGHYVRIWKSKPQTGWKIVLEMINTD
jgi:ketosteroid isomerase-like protein